MTNFVGLRATRHAMSRQSRMGQIIQLGIVEQVPDASVETLADRHVLPMVVSGVELFYIETSQL